MKIVISCFLIVLINGAEWQSGLDQVIKNQPQLTLTSNYPIHTQVDITFDKPFSEVPEVLTMFEQITYESMLDVDICLSLGQITKSGFELRYRLGGPARVLNLKVRWIAFLDKTVQLTYKELNFMQLRELRQGSGIREDEFEIPLITGITNPKVSAFLVGFKINPENGPYALQINCALDEDIKNVNLNLKTKDSTHIRFAKVAVIAVSSESKAFTKQGGVDSRGFNYFEEQSTSGIRRVEYNQKLPDSLLNSPQDNILSQGIRGFDANSTQSELISMSLEKYRVEDQSYEMNFGPQ